jgi:hypothetical protein
METLLQTMPDKRRRTIKQTAVTAVKNSFADNTWRVRYPQFRKWEEFAAEFDMDPLPRTDWSRPEQTRFEALVDTFALEEYKRCEDKQNAAGTYEAIFSGINAVLTTVFHRPPLTSTRLATWKRSYKMNHDKPVQQAPPIKPIHVRKLHEWASAATGPSPLWKWCVAHAIAIMWFLAGRWDDFCNIDIASTLDNIQTARAAGTKAVMFVLFGRKNMNRPCEVVISDASYGGINPIDSLLWFTTTFGRTINTIKHRPGTKQAGAWLVPFGRKRTPKKGQGTFMLESDTQRLCNYNLFLKMFRLAMQQLNSKPPKGMKWGLHGARSGWTTEAYQHETTLSEHLIQTHMQVNSAEVSRLYDRNAQASVATAADRMAASAFAASN